MKLVILRGKTGTGKTTLLGKIEKEFNYKKVEIDAIKIKKYGTTSKCKPKSDFREAGQIADNLLKKGNNVIVEEAFLDKNHIDFFIGGLDIEPEIIYIRLECSKETAIKRKTNLKKDTVANQHSRKTDDIKDEMVFNTDKTTISSILDRIKEKL